MEKSRSSRYRSTYLMWKSPTPHATDLPILCGGVHCRMLQVYLSDVEEFGASRCRIYLTDVEESSNACYRSTYLMWKSPAPHATYLPI
ncbi:hypothetical protein RRG08_025528 [Elysia crispata]|uniref:Uncharacterized protein n=1 Tax=Elysia crispata TaxID=231223 RepID=A0AAE1A107_9GAST|nr:hypothetical protein RRG08_025528 [Elysia crispata]